MCAIVDTNVANTTIGGASTEAGRKFLHHVSNGSLKLVIGGGKLRTELKGCSFQFQRWLSNAIQTGLILNKEDEIVDKAETKLKKAGKCSSDDEHLVALAQVTGARLVFTNDRNLQDDCKNLLSPSGKIYTTNDGRTAFSRDKHTLLSTTTCRSMLKSIRFTEKQS